MSVSVHLNLGMFMFIINNNNNKSAQSNLGRGPRRGGVAHGAGLWPACVASVPWRSFMNMAKLNWLS